jgi:hypothetical protein
MNHVPDNDSSEVTLCIAGSRHFKNYELFCYILDNVIMPSLLKRYSSIDKIIEGGARGVDSFAKRYAEERGFNHAQYPANWDKHGKSAGPIRNTEMAEDGTALWCYHIGGNGSSDVISKFSARGKFVISTRV